MQLQEIKNKSIVGLKNRISTVTINNNFIDELSLKFKYGEITLVDFIKGITEDLTYTIIETYENNFVICDKKSNFQFTSYINPADSNKIWEDDIEIKFIKAYPELSEIYRKNKLEIQSASCQGCAKNGKFYQLINELMFVDNNERDNSFFIDLYGHRFYEALLKQPKINKPQPGQKQIDVIYKVPPQVFKNDMVAKIRQMQLQLKEMNTSLEKYIQ